VAAPLEGDHQEAGPAGGASWDLQQRRIPPERLGGEEVDAVLAQVGLALARINTSRLRLESIPLRSFDFEDVGNDLVNGCSGHKKDRQSCEDGGNINDLTWESLT
jgi:hypothetical protein